MQIENMQHSQQKNYDSEMHWQCLKVICTFAKKNSLENYEEKKMLLLQNLNENMQMLNELESTEYLSKLGVEQVVIVMRSLLIEPTPLDFRQNVYKFFRYLMTNESLGVLYNKVGLPLFMCKSFERMFKGTSNSRSEQNYKVYMNEIIEVLKLIKKWIMVGKDSFPKILANSLVAFHQYKPNYQYDEEVKFYHNCMEPLSLSVVNFIRELAVQNPKLCGTVGGIQILVDSIINPAFKDASEEIVLTLLYLANDPLNRKQLSKYLDFGKLFALFTDIDYTVTMDKSTMKDPSFLQSKFEEMLSLAKKALIIIIKNWSGFILLGQERLSIQSLVQALKQPIKKIVRDSIFEIIQDILQLGSCQVKNNSTFKIQSLVNQYLVITLQLFLECGLMKTIVELTSYSDQEVRGQALLLLKQLVILCQNLLPEASSTTDFLLSSINSPIDMQQPKAWCQDLISKMGNYCFDNYIKSQRTNKRQASQLVNKCASFLLNKQTGLPCYQINDECVQRLKQQMFGEQDEMSFKTLMQQTNITQHKTEYAKWDWQVIQQIVEQHLHLPVRLNELKKNKMLKHLIQFYLPSKEQFVDLEWKPDNFKYARVGYLLVNSLLQNAEGTKFISNPMSTQFTVQKSFMHELQQYLKDYAGQQRLGAGRIEVISRQNSIAFQNKDESLHDLINNPHKPSVKYLKYLDQPTFSRKMIREYISWIGILTRYKSGNQLLQQFQIMEILMKLYVNKEGIHDHVVVQVLLSLDYSMEDTSRIFFQYCLENGSMSVMINCLEVLRLLYRSELKDFMNWGVDLLVTRLYQGSREVQNKTLDIIEEISRDPQMMKKVVERCPDHTVMANSKFIVQLLRIPEGFHYLTHLKQQTEKEVNKWLLTKNQEYIQEVEKCLLNSLEILPADLQNCFRFPNLSQNQSEFTSVNLVQVLPWTIMVLDDEDQPMSLRLSVRQDIANHRTILITEESGDLFSFKALSQFNVQLYLAIGALNINFHCQQQDTPMFIQCDDKDLRLSSSQSQSIKTDNQEASPHKTVIYKNNVKFYLEYNYDQVRLKKVKVIVTLKDKSQNQEEIPPHIFGELVQTKEGVDFLQTHHYLDTLEKQLREGSTLEKRCALWAIGNIGYTELGIEIVIQRGLLEEVVQMVNKCDHLSMKGVCLYILNMLANTLQGRLALADNHWHSYNNSQLGWIVVPSSLDHIFNIPSPHPQDSTHFWPLHPQWSSFIRDKNLHNQDTYKIFEYFQMLTNQLKDNQGRQEINKKYKTNPEIFTDEKVFVIVVQMLSYFKFTLENRRFIFDKFDKLMNNPQKIFVILDDNPNLIFHL